jgi:MurNAc alpha-1-phosphate uridylyltransferase
MPPRALILAAGRGERMRPLTDTTPKPLLRVQGKPLIAWHLESLARAGIREVVVNTAWLEEQFPPALGDGSRWGLSIRYSTEGRDHGGALETAGGIAKALPWLGDVFWVVAGDVFLPGFPFDAADAEAFAMSRRWCHLWMVPNAAHHPRGDFAIGPGGLLAHEPQGERMTWGSVGLFGAAMFAGIEPGTRMALRPLLEAGIARGLVGGQAWTGRWTDVGTPQRLASLQSGD